MASATKQKEFLDALGEGLQNVESPPPDGMWRMSFGEIRLHTTAGILRGETEAIHDLAGYAALAGMIGGLGISVGTHNEPKQIRVYSISVPSQAVFATSRST